MSKLDFTDVMYDNLAFIKQSKSYIGSNPSTNKHIENWLDKAMTELKHINELSQSDAKEIPKQKETPKYKSRYDDIVGADLPTGKNGYTDYMDMSNMPSF